MFEVQRMQPGLLPTTHQVALRIDCRAPWPRPAVCSMGAAGRVCDRTSTCCRQEYLAASGVPYTAVLPCCFYDNIAKLFMFQAQPEGSRTWSDNLGTAPLLMHAVADIGKSAASARCWPLPPGLLLATRMPHCSTLAQLRTCFRWPAFWIAGPGGSTGACATPVWRAEQLLMRACMRAAVFADLEKYAGQTDPVVREAISWTQVADILTEVTGTKVRRGPPAAGRRRRASRLVCVLPREDCVTAGPQPGVAA